VPYQRILDTFMQLAPAGPVAEPLTVPWVDT
jgi:hypothetical protein